MGVAKVVTRIGFGISLAFVGIAHYLDAASFAEAVGRGLGPLESLGMAWGYILPALLIGGGVLLALGLYTTVGTFLAGVGLLSIPAGLMLKSVLSGISLNETMPPAMNALIWILVFHAAVRGCHGGHQHECHCDAPMKAVGPAPKPAPAVMPKRSPMIAKATPKKGKKR